MRWLRAGWRWLRALSGDDAYERYLAHLADCHCGAPALTRRDFVRRQQQHRWSGISRCC
jgi:uncharacterized short protein YbdD (DUF466 family)